MNKKFNFRAAKQNLTAGVMSSLLALAVAPVYAADTGPMQDFVDCLHKIDPTHQTVANAVACVHDGAYTTVTMSEESGQPACKLQDGTRLPRVIFSIPIPGASGSKGLIYFRPSFSLCTQGGIINHIEVGQDVPRSTRTDDPALKNFPYLQEMADFDLNPGHSTRPWNFTEFLTGLNKADAVLDAKTPPNPKGCSECHDRMGTMAVPAAVPPGTANLFLPIPAAVAEGTLWTNDPLVEGYVTPVPLNPLGKMDGICTGIANSTQLANSKNHSLKDLATDLCNKLSAKIGS